MKISEMTNNELADYIVNVIGGGIFKEYYAEAAARLRKTCTKNFKCDSLGELLAVEQRKVDALRSNLKVAEDALRNLQERLVAGVYDGTIDPHEALKITEDAIAAIREEGGMK